jgi:hypothetical protein
MADDVTITVRVDNQTGPGITSVQASINRLSRTARDSNGSFKDLKATMLSLAPAAVPVAAAMAPIAVKAGAAGLAVAAFGAALVPQVANLKSAADAQDKYTTAVTKYGAGSKQALQAQQFIADTLKGMPAPTQRAAAAYSNLRDQFKGFSDSSAKFTMVPVEHSFAVLGAILPKLKPMVQGTSTQLDRLMKVAGGAVNTSAFDGLTKRLSQFANNSLKSATDGAIHFVRVLSEGNARGPLTEFMDYARRQGPAVKELLSNLMQALGNIAAGAAQAGPGLLTIVNAFAKLVAAVPPQLIGNLMQLYAAFKLIKLAGAGISTVGGSIASLATSLGALRTTAAGAGGGLAGLRAAFMSLGTAAKASLIVAGIAAAVVVIKKLSDIGKDAPPNVDKLTTALGNLGRTGKASGEAARVFGKNLGELYDSVRSLTDPSTVDKVQQGIVKVLSLGQWDSTPVEDAKEKFDAIDKSLENLVRGGKGKLAAAAVKDLAAAYVKSGGSAKDFTSKLDGYKSALADQAFEQKLAAESQGLFGQAAQNAAAKLDAQKASADGLRGAIQALNDVQRQGLGGMIGFEAAIDAAAKAAKDNAGALSMTHGQLDLNSEKARNAAGALQDLADKTDSAAAASRESTGSWEGAISIYNRGRAELIKQAQAMGLNKDQAAQLADQILKIPDKTARVKMDDEDARAGLNAFNAAVKRTPGSKSVTLKTLSSSAEAVLEAFGYKVKRLPDGSVKVTAKTGGALSGIRNVAGAIASLHDKTVTLTSIHNVITNSKTYRSVHDIVGATGGLFTGKAFRYADGGPVRGPGTGTSDDVPAPWLSDGEFVIRKASVDKYGERMLQAINDGRYQGPGYAKGGKVSKQTQAERQARSDAMSQLTISHFGHYAGYQRSEFGSALGRPDSISSLVNALNEWRGIIKKATHGATENRLLKQLDSTGKKLLGYEKAHEKLTKSLEKAKDKLNSLKDASAQLASSVKGNLISSANITKGASGEGTVTLSSVRSGLIASRDKVTAFANALKALKSKGFSKSIIQQVAEAGIDGGGLETAGALLQASSSEVASINQMQGQIASAAGSAGKTTADAVYAKAIKDQTKIVDKLTKQEHSLQKSMDKLTKAMEKAVEKAFGKKAAGGIVGAAASGGLRSNLTWVGEQGPELLDLPAGARVWSNPDSRRKAAAQAPWASMLNSPHRAPAVAAGGAATAARDSQPIVIQVRIGEKDFGELWVDTGRKQVRSRGSIEATLRPPRGR